MAQTISLSALGLKKFSPRDKNTQRYMFRMEFYKSATLKGKSLNIVFLRSAWRE